MIETMIAKAMEARKNAYAPYSHFQVGVCLQGEGGALYTGCNVENSSFSATNCGERTAFFYAISQGERKFRRIVIVGGKENEKLEFCPPCGVCRQVMSEFCDPETFEIILPTAPGEYKTYRLKELLPIQFGKEMLENYEEK